MKTLNTYKHLKKMLSRQVTEKGFLFTTHIVVMSDHRGMKQK